LSIKGSSILQIGHLPCYVNEFKEEKENGLVSSALCFIIMISKN